MRKLGYMCLPTLYTTAQLYLKELGVTGMVFNLYVFRLRDHIVRLINSARIVGFDIGYTVEQLVDTVVEVIKANGFKENVCIRPIAFIGGGKHISRHLGYACRRSYSSIPLR